MITVRNNIRRYLTWFLLWFKKYFLNNTALSKNFSTFKASYLFCSCLILVLTHEGQSEVSDSATWKLFKYIWEYRAVHKSYVELFVSKLPFVWPVSFTQSFLVTVQALCWSWLRIQPLFVCFAPIWPLTFPLWMRPSCCVTVCQGLIESILRKSEGQPTSPPLSP